MSVLLNNPQFFQLHLLQLLQAQQSITTPILPVIPTIISVNVQPPSIPTPSPFNESQESTLSSAPIQTGRDIPFTPEEAYSLLTSATQHTDNVLDFD